MAQSTDFTPLSGCAVCIFREKKIFTRFSHVFRSQKSTHYKNLVFTLLRTFGPLETDLFFIKTWLNREKSTFFALKHIENLIKIAFFAKIRTGHALLKTAVPCYGAMANPSEKSAISYPKNA